MKTGIENASGVLANEEPIKDIKSGIKHREIIIFKIFLTAV